MNRQIDDLAHISAMLRDRDLKSVALIVSKLNAIRSDVAILEKPRKDRLSNAAIDLARLSGVDVRWMAETERRILRLRQQEAALRVSHESALARARQAFGRADVTARLAGVRRPV